MSSMNINRLLKIATKNEQKEKTSGGSGKLGIDTRLSAPKKEVRQSGVSEAVKAFLEKKAEEEKQKREEENRKREQLLKLRSEAKNNKMANAMANRTKDKPKIVLDGSSSSKSSSSGKGKGSDANTSGTAAADDETAGVDLEHLFTKNDRRQARLPADVMQNVLQMMKDRDERRRKKEEEEEKKKEDEKRQAEEEKEKAKFREKAAKLAAAIGKGGLGKRDEDDGKRKGPSSSLMAPKREALSKFAALSSRSVGSSKDKKREGGSGGGSGKGDKHKKGDSVPLSFEALMAIANGAAPPPSKKSESSSEEEEEEPKNAVPEKRPMTQEEKDRISRVSSKEYKDWLERGGTPPPGYEGKASRKRKASQQLQIKSSARCDSDDEERTVNKRDERDAVEAKRSKIDSGKSSGGYVPKPIRRDDTGRNEPVYKPTAKPIKDNRTVFAKDERRRDIDEKRKDDRYEDRTKRKEEVGSSSSSRRESVIESVKRRLHEDADFLSVTSKHSEKNGNITSNGSGHAQKSSQKPSSSGGSSNHDRQKTSHGAPSNHDRQKSSSSSGSTSAKNGAAGGIGGDMDALQKFFKQYEELKKSGILNEDVIKNLAGSQGSVSSSQQKQSTSAGKAQDLKSKPSSTFKQPSSSSNVPKQGSSKSSNSQSEDRMRPGSQSLNRDSNRGHSSHQSGDRLHSSSQSERGKAIRSDRDLSHTGRDGRPGNSSVGKPGEKYISPWDRIYNSLPKTEKKPPPKYEVDSTDDEEDDDDDDYDDDDLDDFIDDEEVEDYGKVNVSEYIRQITGYDRRRYKNERDDDLRGMESSYVQQQKEEAFSKRAGMLEDLEDIRMEQEALKRKALEKKRKLKQK